MRRLLLLLFLLTNFLRAQKSPHVAIAYLNHKKIVVADTSGAVIRIVPVPFKREVSGIAVDNSGTQVIATARTFGRGEFGGDFFLWTARSGKWVQITHGPYVFKEKEKGHREVYDQAAFSPDGHSIAFAIHYESEYDDNDIVDASGPAALMRLGTSKVNVIKSTSGDGKDPTGPPWLSNAPQWSPDGKQLLLSFESGFAVIDLRSGRLRNLNPEIERGAGTYAVNWLDSSRVLFLAFFDDISKDPIPHALNLQDGSVTDAPQNLRGVAGKLLGFNSELWVVEVSGVSEVHGRSVWKLPKPAIFGLAPAYFER